MKTALESYMETVTVQEKTKILAEQELHQLQQTPDINAILETIQNGINYSIKEGKFQRTIRLIEAKIYTKYNGIFTGWQLLTQKSNWTDYNKNVDAFYTIPRIGSPVLNYRNIIEALETLGYACSIKDNFVNKATSKTGRYASSYKIKEITINWENYLKIMMEEVKNG